MDIVKTVLGITVVAVVIWAAAVPILTDGIETIATAESNTDERYLTMTDGARIVFDSTAEGFTINGESHTWVTGSTGSTPDRLSTPVIFGSDFVLVPPVSLGSGNYSDPVVVTESGSQGTASHLEISNGRLTYNDGTDDHDVAVSGPVFYVSDKGTYGLYKGSANIDDRARAYVIICSWASQSTRTVGIYSLVDGETSPVFPAIYWTSGSEVTTASDVTINATVDDHETYYTYTITGATVDGTNHATGHMTIVCPVEYHVITESDATLRTIASVLPVLMVLVLLVGAAYTLIRREA